MIRISRKVLNGVVLLCLREPRANRTQPVDRGPHDRHRSKNAILNSKRTLGNRINRLLLISKHKSSQKINLTDSQNTENDVPVEEKKKTQNIFDKRLTVDEIDEISIEDIEKGVTQALIKIFLGPQNATLRVVSHSSTLL